MNRATWAVGLGAIFVSPTAFRSGLTEAYPPHAPSPQDGGQWSSSWAWNAPAVCAPTPSTEEARFMHWDQEALPTWDRTLPPCTSSYDSTQYSSRACFSPHCEPLISASSIKECGRKRGEWLDSTDKHQCQPQNNRSQELQGEKVSGGVTHM